MKHNPTRHDVLNALEAFFSPCIEIEWRDTPGGRRYGCARVTDWKYFAQFRDEAGIRSISLTESDMDPFSQKASEYGWSVSTTESPFNRRKKI
jgi:predicted HD phosphohydrolase